MLIKATMSYSITHVYLIGNAACNEKNQIRNNLSDQVPPGGIN